MRMADMAAIQVAQVAAALARFAIAITPEMPCARCGHPASQHDLDRTAIQPDQPTGGEGCLNGWDADVAGCDCDQFLVKESAA